MQAVSDPLKDLAPADLDVVKQELDSLNPRAKVFQRRVGNSSVFFLAPRPSIDAAVNDALLLQDARQYPSTRAVLESLGQPIPSTDADDAEKHQPSQSDKEDGSGSQRQPQAVRRSSSTGSKGKGKGKGKGKRKSR